MKVLGIIGLSLMLTACVGFSVEKYDVNTPQNYGNAKYNAERVLPNVTFKTVEVYKQNMFSPSFNYVMLFQCDSAGNGCIEVQRTPNTTPGLIAGLIAPMLQAGAIVGGAALIGDGLKHSGSQTNVQNDSSSNSSSNSASSATAKSHSSSSNTNINVNSNSATGGNGGSGGSGGNGGNGGNGGTGGNGNPGLGCGGPHVC